MTSLESQSDNNSVQTHAHYTSNLLTLEQSDLKRQTPELLLCTLPIQELQDAKFLASKNQASIVSSKASYRLTKVGTSNCLVVWEKKPPSTSPNKRTRTDVTSARLIQPGGSGANFLAGTPTDVNIQELKALVQRQPHPSTDELVNWLQVSLHQLHQALATLPSICVNNAWRLLDEDSVFQVKAAVVATACEVADQDLQDENAAEQQVQQRLLGIPHPHIVASKFVALAKQSNTPPRSFWNPNVISLWVCQELLRQQPEWETHNFLETCQARLPFGDIYEGKVTLDWLKSQEELTRSSLQMEADTISWKAL